MKGWVGCVCVRQYSGESKQLMLQLDGDRRFIKCAQPNWRCGSGTGTVYMYQSTKAVT